MKSSTLVCFGAFLVFCFVDQLVQADDTSDDLARIGTKKGVVALVGAPEQGADHLVDLAKSSDLIIYFQSDSESQVAAVREVAENADLLGTRIFAHLGSYDSIRLARNLADCILVAPSAQAKLKDAELLRALRPRATAHVGQRKLVKPVPDGIDEWTHAYHGPDNNPQSNDQHVKGNFNTQFLATPKFSPMPEQSVIAGGRMYKAMGHIAHKANQNEWLNTLLCINAYNGTILWKRPNPPGFMIHRNTMIATEDALYMADHESCKIFDGETGELRDEIKIPADITDGPVWKWMAIRDGVLYALVGNLEIKVDTQKSERRGLGHWPWGMWKGHDYNDPRTAFGHGRTFVAIDLKSKKPLWHYRDEEFLDARGVCMNKNQILFCSPGKFVASIDRSDGKVAWKNTDKDLLEAIGPNARAQHYVTGYATTCYMKCTEDYILFAGPQRNKLVCAMSADGKLNWTQPTGNWQLVLRDDAVYAAGPQGKNGIKIDYSTGDIITEFPARRACTRATGCADSIFYRASGGTVRVITETNTAQHIAPMRPPCQDGVLISNGNLYWGPWMCGCQLSLYGNICLTAMNDPLPENVYTDALQGYADIEKVAPLQANAADWSVFRGSNARNDVTSVEIPAGTSLKWKADICSNELPTAPVTAGGLVFLADRTGTVHALDGEGNRVWKQHTSGPVYFPPTVANDRVYAGSADGRVYAFEATTGRALWVFRVAPTDRLIPVFGKLISTWPVAGGVVVEGDTVYAAAGVAHYDGTYVVALDATTGKLKAQNSTSGTLSSQVNSGISMQGNLSIVDGELRFLAGGVYETARYDLKTLECLNTPKVQVNSQYRTAFYPYYPEYGKYLSLDHTCGDGASLCHDASYEGSVFTNLALLPPGAPKQQKEAARWIRRRRGGEDPKNVWTDKGNRRFTSYVVSKDQLLATGHSDQTPDETFLVAINIKDGTDAWLQKTPAEVVKGGTAIDHKGRIFVSLENGQLLCFGPD